MLESKHPLKVFLCHARAGRDAVRALDGRVALSGAQRSRRAYRDHARLTKDGVDAWLDKAKLLPGQGFDGLNLTDWELEIRKAV